MERYDDLYVDTVQDDIMRDVGEEFRSQEPFSESVYAGICERCTIGREFEGSTRSWGILYRHNWSLESDGVDKWEEELQSRSILQPEGIACFLRPRH